MADMSTVKDLAGIVQSILTIAAILAALVFALYKLRQFRDFKPHVTITQTVTHRSNSNSYVHLMATATLHNSSKVKLDFRKGYFRLQGISPVSDEDVESLYAEVFRYKKSRHLQWPTLDEVSRAWDKNELIIEPGESHQETCELIVSAGVESVIIYTYFYNPKHPGVSEGWGATTVHDIMVQ